MSSEFAVVAAVGAAKPVSRTISEMARLLETATLRSDDRIYLQCHGPEDGTRQPVPAPHERLATNAIVSSALGRRALRRPCAGPPRLPRRRERGSRTLMHVPGSTCAAPTRDESRRSPHSQPPSRSELGDRRSQRRAESPSDRWRRCICSGQGARDGPALLVLVRPRGIGFAVASQRPIAQTGGSAAVKTAMDGTVVMVPPSCGKQGSR